MTGRLLAIGDIHGQADHIEVLLDVVRPTPADRLILLGDYVGGGPESARALDIVGRLIRQLGAVALRGNHDDVMINALDDPDIFERWARGHGAETVASYGTSTDRPSAAAIERRHGPLLRSLKLWHEEPEAIFVHAGVEPALPMSEQSPVTLLWQKQYAATPPHLSGKTIVCGHTSQKDGLPHEFGSTLCIDTNAKDGNWLTCLDVLTRQYRQARADGSTRTFTLNEDSD